MKFSARQIFASAGGAVLAATIASLFGVKGTVIGVAVGSAATTFGTAFFSQSIERGHKAVKQVAVRVPDRTALLRRIGSTETTGVVVTETEHAAEEGDSAITDTPAQTESQGDETVVIEDPILDPGPSTIEMSAVPSGVLDLDELPGTVRQRRSIPWRAIAGTAAIVFALSLLVVTGIELLSGRPLSDLFGHSKSNDPSVGQLFNSPPATTTTTSTTTTSTTSTTTSTTSTTTTTVPGETTTTTSPTGSSTTTTTGTSSSSSTTTSTG